ncbi:MAG TPA: nuclear transport factor 2 family protein [Streptosporangiaceae bacterium]|nr:nuclear transport factor 2 family protein [Streptosporangiaceae bacterium]
MIDESLLAERRLARQGEAMAMDDEAREVIQRFHDALNRRDLDALGDLITDDCVFDATSPAPDGTRHVGRQAVLEACRAFFAGSPTTHFEMEEIFGAGDRVIVRWLYRWADGHVRGVDVLRVRAGRVAETLAYVKG